MKLQSETPFPSDAAVQRGNFISLRRIAVTLTMQRAVDDIRESRISPQALAQLGGTVQEEMELNPGFSLSHPVRAEIHPSG